jgi:hypothetical protein
LRTNPIQALAVLKEAENQRVVVSNVTTAAIAFAFAISLLFCGWRWRRWCILSCGHRRHHKPSFPVFKVTGLLSRFLEHLARPSRLLFSNSESDNIALKSCGWRQHAALIVFKNSLIERHVLKRASARCGSTIIRPNWDSLCLPEVVSTKPNMRVAEIWIR